VVVEDMREDRNSMHLTIAIKDDRILIDFHTANIRPWRRELNIEINSMNPRERM
jgi:hypothetical protein